MVDLRTIRALLKEFSVSPVPVRSWTITDAGAISVEYLPPAHAAAQAPADAPAPARAVTQLALARRPHALASLYAALPAVTNESTP